MEIKHNILLHRIIIVAVLFGSLVQASQPTFFSIDWFKRVFGGKAEKPYQEKIPVDTLFENTETTSQGQEKQLQEKIDYPLFGNDTPAQGKGIQLDDYEYDEHQQQDPDPHIPSESSVPEASECPKDLCKFYIHTVVIAIVMSIFSLFFCILYCNEKHVSVKYFEAKHAARKKRPVTDPGV